MIHQYFTASAKAFAAQASRFQKDERGVLIVFALMMLTLMLLMGGLALDLMRYETTRVNLQQTLDRSVLAAAALDQTMDPDAVVRDYMLKAGLTDQLASITVEDGMNYRSVRSTGLADTKPFFLPMMGIERFDAKAVSKAEQGMSNVEIALVLDVSGSMSGAKIAALKVAASNFVDTVFAQDVNNRVTVTIVPYNAQVNVGPVLRDQFNTTHLNGVANVNCPELPVSTYDVAAIPLTTELPMMAYADISGSTNKVTSFVSPADNSYAKPSYSSVYCKPSTVNVVRLPQNDPDTLKTQINALQAAGNTSITLGMKWGLTLLDPTMRASFAGLIGSGDIPAEAVGRPFDFDDAQAMKVIVLMTDGEHVSHTRVTDAYKTGAAPIWKSTGDGNYSVRHVTGRPAVAGTNEYYVPHLGTWQAVAWNSGAGTVQQDWKDIWSNLKLTYVAWQFYARPLGTSNSTRTSIYDAQVAAMRSTYESVGTMDAHLQQSCGLAKDNGILVFGIAVEAPIHGQDVIQACASSDAHYFDASADTLATAFQTIATNITQLKLTQ